jgi:hypothetical protein
VAWAHRPEMQADCRFRRAGFSICAIRHDPNCTICAAAALRPGPRAERDSGSVLAWLLLDGFRASGYGDPQRQRGRFDGYRDDDC